MNSINDKEKAIIKEKCKEIAKNREKSFSAVEKDSCFILGENLERFHLNSIRFYEPDNMSNIKKELESVFEKRNTKDMNELATICAVAAMKNRKVTEESIAEVSEYVYEF